MTTYNSWGSDDPVQETKGGTAQSSWTTGDILYSSASNTLSKLGIGSEDEILAVSASGIPEWIAMSASGAGNWTLIESIATTSGSTVTKTSGLGTAYDNYMLVFNDVGYGSDPGDMDISFSDDGGSTYAVNFFGWELEDDVSSFSQSFKDSSTRTVNAPGNHEWNGYIAWQANNAAAWKPMQLHMTTEGVSSNTHNSQWGVFQTTSDIDAFQIDVGGKTFDTGTIYVLGL